ncbi:MAG: SMI1/KNR4 family protein [Aureispira sp.]|nr:SMI1/KNR4 family protein [Aureispira sp.]
MSGIVDLVKYLSEPAFFDKHKGKATLKQLKSLEEDYDLNLPQELKELLLYSDGFVFGNDAFGDLNFWNISDLMNLNLDYEDITDLGFVMVGSDNGGNFFTLDIDNEYGFGHGAVFMHSRSDTSKEWAKYLANNFSELVEKIIQNEDFDNDETYPFLGGEDDLN